MIYGRDGSTGGGGGGGGGGGWGVHTPCLALARGVHGGANFPIKYLNIKQLSLNNNKYN